MGETLAHWCRRAQEEQIHKCLGIVYANYVAAHRKGLMTDDGYRNFQHGLSVIPPVDAASLNVGEDRNHGLTAIAVERAKNYVAADPAFSSRRDFRLCGKEFRYQDLLVSLRYYNPGSGRTASSPAATVRSGSRPVPTSPSNRPPVVVWLTKPASIIGRLSEALAAAGLNSMDDSSFFAQLVAMLGLRPPAGASDTAVCQIRAFVPKAGATLMRPHALSHGYPERFCVVSPFGRFGATADNRGGKAGLPEALATLKDLQELAPSDAAFQSLSAEIRKHVDFRTGDGALLSGQYEIALLHREDDPAVARRTMIERLRRVSPATNIRCSKSASSSAVCPRYSASCI